jgi:hypothetical protein
MRVFVDFLMLRPLFGARALRLAWALFVAEQALRLVSLISGTQATYAPMSFVDWLQFAPLLLTPLVNVVFARLLLEVANMLIGDGRH